MHIVITKTIELTHCWVCLSDEGLHSHHVVPSSYGGEHGPRVTLCGKCHTLIHTVSLNKRKDEWKFRGDTLQVVKLTYLTRVIADARLATKHLQRPMLISQKLSIEQGEKLRAIKKLANKTSLATALEYAIDVAYQRLTPLK